MDSGVKARATPIARIAAFVLLNACAGSTAPPTGRLTYLIANGTEDGKDLYSSVVQVIVPSRGGCSGVLAGPNLVLTAAHCLCIPPQGELRPNTTYAVSHSNRENMVDLKCSKTVEVIAELYGQATAGARPFTGAIRVQVHEGYAFQTNGAADIIGSQMDLAAVYLGKSSKACVWTEASWTARFGRGICSSQWAIRAHGDSAPWHTLLRHGQSPGNRAPERTGQTSRVRQGRSAIP